MDEGTRSVEDGYDSTIVESSDPSHCGSMSEDPCDRSPGYLKVTKMCQKRSPATLAFPSQPRGSFVVPYDPLTDDLEFAPVGKLHSRTVRQEPSKLTVSKCNFPTEADQLLQNTQLKHEAHQIQHLERSMSMFETEQTLLRGTSTGTCPQSSDSQSCRNSESGDVVNSISTVSKHADDPPPSPSRCQDDGPEKIAPETHAFVGDYETKRGEQPSCESRLGSSGQHDLIHSDNSDADTPGSTTATNHLSASLPRTMRNSVLHSQNETARVMKPLKTSLSVNTPSVSPPHATARGPTEEDLLLLLMRRQRSRDRAHAQLCDDVRRLKAENRQLKNVKTDQDTQIDDLRNKWHDCVRHSHVREAEIETIKGKYNKVKDWAHTMQNECDSLRGESCRLSEIILAVKREMKTEMSERKQLLEKVENSSTVLQRAGEIVSDLRDSSTKLQETRESLAFAESKLEKEKLDNKSLTLCIERLEKNQQSLGSQLSEKWTETQRDLAEISRLFQQYDADLLKGTLNQLVGEIQDLQKNCATKTDCSTQSSYLLDVTEKKYRDLIDAVNDMEKAQASHHTGQCSKLSSLIASAGRLMPSLERIQSLERTNQGLTEKIKYAEDARLVADREKNMVYQLADTLRDAQKDIRKGQAHGSTLELEQMNNNNVDLQKRLSSASSNIERLKTELQESRAKRDDLESTMALMTTNYQNKYEQMEESHITKLEDQSARLQVEIDAQHRELTEVKDDLKRSKEEFGDLHRKIVELETEIKVVQETLSDKEDQVISAEQCTQSLKIEDARLREKVRKLEEIVQDRQREVTKLAANEEKVKDLRLIQADLVATLDSRKREIVLLEAKLTDSEQLIRDLRDQVSNAQSLERDYTDSRNKVQQLEKDLEVAEQEVRKVTDLRKTIAATETRLNDVKVDLITAQEVSQQIPHLQRTIEDRDTDLRRLRDDLDIVDRQKKAAHLDSSQKDDRIYNLQNEISRLYNEIDSLRLFREKYQTNENVRAELEACIGRMKEEMKPVEKLVRLLTAEEKKLLTEKVVFDIKAVIRKQNEHSSGASEGMEQHLGEGTALQGTRRTADRTGLTSQQDIIVPDSQSQHALTHAQQTSDEHGSLITSVIYEELGNEAHTSNSHKETSNPTKDISTGDNIRPATSNDEMLLRSSDVGNWSPYSPSQGQLLVPTSTGEISPMRTRQGSQIRHGTPVPRTGTDGERIVKFLTPTQVLREPHTPNSAAKRRQMSEVAEPIAKRRNVNMKDLEIQPPGSEQTSTQARNTIADNPNEFSSGMKGSTGVFGTNMPAPGKKKKVTNSTRKSSKAAKMEAQFNTPMI